MYKYLPPQLHLVLFKTLSGAVLSYDCTISGDGGFISSFFPNQTRNKVNGLFHLIKK